MLEHSSIKSDVPTLAEVQAMNRRSSLSERKVLTVDMTDGDSAPIVKFTGIWGHSDMRAVDRALRRGYKIERARLRKVSIPVSNGGM